MHRSRPILRQESGLCTADFLRDVDDGERDVIGLQVVTMGARTSETVLTLNLERSG